MYPIWIQNKMNCKNCGFKSCRCYESSDLDSEGEDIFYVSDLSSTEDSSDDSSDEDYVYNSSDESSDEDYVYNSSDDDDSD